jgi:hypothetical protein
VLSVMLTGAARQLHVVAEPASGEGNLKIYTGSYFLLEGLRGDADADRDQAITVKELADYVGREVADTAGTLDREQTPILRAQEPDRVLVRGPHLRASKRD